MAPPPIRGSGPSGFSPPPKISGPPQLRIGGAGAPSSDSSRSTSPELKSLNGRVTAAAAGSIKQLIINSTDESTGPLRSLEPTHTPSISYGELLALVSARTTAAEVGEVARNLLVRHSSSSPERSSPEGSPKSPDSTERSSETATIIDTQGRNFNVTITAETAPFVTVGRSGILLYGPPITTEQLTIEQVTDIQHNTNPQMDSRVMEKFIRENIGEAHLQDAKDLFSSTINELAKSPAAEPVSIDLECGGKQLTLIFDRSKNEALLFNKKHFVEGSEKTVHDAVAIPLPGPAGTSKEAEIEPRAVLRSKPNMIALVRRGISNTKMLHTLGQNNPRLQHIISPSKSEYQITSHPESEDHPPEATLITSEERFSHDLMDEINRRDFTVAAFQGHLMEGLQGLSLIHDLGFMHCDAKIENMFLKGNTCVIGDLSTSRKKNSNLTEYGIGIDRQNTGEDKRSFDILSLGLSLVNVGTHSDCISVLRAKPQTAESAAFIDRLEALIPDMTKINPAERPTIQEVIARLRG